MRLNMNRPKMMRKADAARACILLHNAHQSSAAKELAKQDDWKGMAPTARVSAVCRLVASRKHEWKGGVRNA